MKYFTVYVSYYEKILSKARKDNPLRKKDDSENCYTAHHKKPKSLGGKDISDNIILLTPRQHYIAHKLLYKIYEKNYKMTQKNEDWWKMYKMFLAWWRMAYSDNGRVFHPSKDYEQLIGTNRELKSNKPVTEETREKISQALKGQEWSEEAKRNQSKKQKGKRWINNGNDQTRVPEEDLQYWYDNGWELGQLPHTEEHNKNVSEALTGRSLSKENKKNFK